MSSETSERRPLGQGICLKPPREVTAKNSQSMSPRPTETKVRPAKEVEKRNWAETWEVHRAKGNEEMFDRTGKHGRNWKWIKLAFRPHRAQQKYLPI